MKSFENWSMESRILNSKSDILPITCLSECGNNYERRGNRLTTHSWNHTKQSIMNVWECRNSETEKRVCNRFFVIFRYEHSYNGFLWWQDSTSNVYDTTGIWNLCIERVIFESDKRCVQNFLMELCSFIGVYFWSSACSAPKHICCNVCPLIHIFYVIVGQVS